MTYWMFSYHKNSTFLLLSLMFLLVKQFDITYTLQPKAEVKGLLHAEEEMYIIGCTRVLHSEDNKVFLRKIKKKTFKNTNNSWVSFSVYLYCWKTIYHRKLITTSCFIYLFTCIYFIYFIYLLLSS